MESSAHLGPLLSTLNYIFEPKTLVHKLILKGLEFIVDMSKSVFSVVWDKRIPHLQTCEVVMATKNS